MIGYLILIIYCLLFAYLTWRHFHLGLALLFFLLPTYLIRFNFGPLPSTLLEVMIWIITIIWLIKYNKNIIYHLSFIIKQNYNYTLFIATALFLLAATISIFTSIDLRAALGEWKAFYFEPILIFVILITTLNKSPADQQEKNQKIRRLEDYNTQSLNLSIFQSSLLNTIIYSLILSGLITSLLAIYQHFTGWLVPYDFWQNRNTFRVTAWYGFPNAVGLFLAPLIPFAMYLFKQNFTWLGNRNWKLETGNCWPLVTLISSFLFLISSSFAILFAKNIGALAGALVGIFIILIYYKKTRWWTIATGLVGIGVLITIFTQTNFLKSDLALKNYSSSLRINIWAETSVFLQNHPLKGAGLASYAKLIAPYRIDKKIEVFAHPHNLLLTMWVNLGLLGLAAFVWIVVAFFRIGMVEIKNSTFVPSSGRGKLKIKNYEPFILSSMIVILIMGLIDSPYIKNDLAILFWLLPALLIINNQSRSV